MYSAQYWINHLNLQPHPEGGYYNETYCATENIPMEALSSRFNGDRAYGTSIYFLLEQPSFSAFHRIASDEIWHFYTGDALEILILNEEDRSLKIVRLGSNPENDEVFQTVVPAGQWFGARPAVGSQYALVGCTVAPGFDFEDFEMGQRAHLLETFPAYGDTIIQMTT